MSEFRDLKPEEFRIFFEPASKGDSGALRIRDFLELPFADECLNERYYAHSSPGMHSSFSQWVRYCGAHLRGR